MDIKNGPYTYQVGKIVAETSEYRLYLCLQVETERQCLLQIATTVEHNGGLDRAAYILRELERRAQELEKEYADAQTKPQPPLNYNLGFPELVDGFVCEEQGGRRVNILAFRGVAEVGRMVPLSTVTTKDHLRVDFRTSAWIMGKLLKLLVFAHGEGIAVGLMAGRNILIEPDQHYVLIFDWSAAETHSETVPRETRCQEIAQAAQAVITVLGGDPATGNFPDDDDPALDQYITHLLQLARGSENQASRAHAQFYELVDALWERQFYPFTTKPLTP